MNQNTSLSMGPTKIQNTDEVNSGSYEDLDNWNQSTTEAAAVSGLQYLRDGKSNVLSKLLTGA